MSFNHSLSSLFQKSFFVIISFAAKYNCQGDYHDSNKSNWEVDNWTDFFFGCYFIQNKTYFFVIVIENGVVLLQEDVSEGKIILVWVTSSWNEIFAECS